MKKVILKVEGMKCEGCKNRLQNYLNSKEGVNAQVDLENKEAVIEYDDKLEIKDLEDYIDDIGFKSLGKK